MTFARGGYSNLILRALPPSEMELLEQKAERVSMKPRQVICEAGMPIEHAYFPESGMVSLVLALSDGRTVEAAALGIEGWVGYELLTGFSESSLRAVGQVAGEGILIQRAHLLEALPSCPELVRLGLRFSGLVQAILAQNVGCGQMHQMGERLARWLLTVKDLTRSPRFDLTHEFMAEMLGSNRPTVTIAARTLAQAGLISYSRGRIEILDMAGLEDGACECYRVLRPQYDRLD